MPCQAAWRTGMPQVALASPTLPHWPMLTSTLVSVGQPVLSSLDRHARPGASRRNWARPNPTPLLPATQRRDVDCRAAVCPGSRARQAGALCAWLPAAAAGCRPAGTAAK